MKDCLALHVGSAPYHRKHDACTTASWPVERELVASIEDEIRRRFIERLADGGIDEAVTDAIERELDSEERLSAERFIAVFERQESEVGQ